MKNKKKNKGITLISMVITIIILLILAGISIVLLKDTNLINKTLLAEEKEKESEALEKLKQKVLEVQIDKNGNATLQDFINALDKDSENEYIISTQIASISGNIPDISELSKIYVKCYDYWFEVDKSLNITVVQKSNNDTENNYIIYDANGGKNAPNSQPKSNNIISDIVPTRENYIFKGWGNSKDSKEVLYKSGEKYTGKSSIILYAIWEKESIKASNLEEFLIKTNTKLSEKDVVGEDFLEKISTSEKNKAILLSSNNMVDTLLENTTYLDDFDVKLVPTLSSNSDVLVSSQYSSKYAGYMAFDKNYDSYWSTSQWQTTNAYIGYNMKDRTKVYFASMYNGYSGDYKSNIVKLQCSNDNNNWIDASDEIKLDNVSKTFYIKNTKEIGNAYQYWRILIKSGYASNYVGITEMQFYGTKENVDDNTENKIEDREDKELLNMCDEKLKNILLKTNIELSISDVLTKSFFEKLNQNNENKKIFINMSNVIDKILENKNVSKLLDEINIGLVPVLSSNSNVLFSSQYSDEYAGYMAFDRNYGSYWSTAQWQTTNAYIGYDMDYRTKVYFASMYNGYSGNYKSNIVKLQCSDDNTNWVDASEDIILNNTSKTFYIKNTKEKENAYQYWRILIKSGYASDYVASPFVQFYGIN